MKDWAVVFLVIACLAVVSVAFVVVGTQANCPPPTEQRLSR